MNTSSIEDGSIIYSGGWSQLYFGYIVYEIVNHFKIRMNTSAKKVDVQVTDIVIEVFYNKNLIVAHRRF